MKKFVLCIITFVFTFMLAVNSCSAEVLNIENEAKHQARVMKIGFKLLNENQIKGRMTFLYDGQKVVNALAYSASKKVVIYKGLINLVDSDDELAGVIAHEITHGIDHHDGLWKRISMSKSSKSYEVRADKGAVDLMVNAGYNPVAFIVVLNKILEEPSWFEISESHPVGSHRLNYVYEYIYSRYPSYLADSQYKDNLYYQNFLLNSQDWRKQVKLKYENPQPSTKKWNTSL